MSNNLFILDGQNDSILGHINKKYVIDNEHEQDLQTYRDMFRFTVLGDKPYAEYLVGRNGIIAPGEDGELLEFRIFESVKYRDSEGLKVEVYSLATFLDLKNARIIEPHTTSSESAEWHARQALAGMEWQVGQVDFKGVRSITFDNYTNPYDYLKRIAREFDLELRFYIKTDGSKVTGRYVDLIERVGEWRGRTVEFGRDLQGIRRIEQTDQIVTALYGIGPEREDGTRLEVFVEDKEALERWGRNGRHIVDVYEPISERSDMTKEELEQYTRTELNKRINAVVSYEADILDLENVPGLEDKKIRFGDTIRIKDLKFNPALYVEARVHNQVRDVFNKDSKRVILGDYIEYTEEEVKALFKQMQTEIRRRLERLVLVSIVSSAGNVFKNGIGSTELMAKTFLNGNEVDEDGTKYEYRWHKFDKNGDYVPGFYKEGKTITVNASDIDEKASFRVEIILDDEVLTVHEITLTNVFDGEDGEPGPPGPKGDPGPQGPPGTSITSIVEYYLAIDQSSGVTRSTPGWTTTIQQMTPQKRYLWNYERINFSDGTHQNTNPVIIGVYGDEGEEGRSIVDITEYYLATSESSGVTRSTSGWTTTMQVTTPEKRYLWNYEEITWNKAPTKTYTEPVIIGVHGEQGPKGEDGKTFYTWIKYADTPTSGMSDNPEGKEYIGIAYNKETPTPSTNYADYVWSKFKGEQGVPGPPGEDGQPTYTWVKYADDEHGNGMSDSPDGKLYIGLAFNKTTPEESNNPADYTWSLMPQNIEIGGRNLITQSSVSGYIVTVNGYVYTLTKTPSIAGNPYVRIPHTLFENDTEYVITFKARKISGNVYRLAGHSTLARHETTRLFIDGVEQTHKLTNGWSNVGTANFPNDNEVHRYEIRFKTVSDVSSVSTPYWYIQPNRPQYDSDSFVLEIWDWKLEKGNKATDWTPAPEDVQEQIDEAKQEAEEAKQEAQNAMSTADGKNTVFRQSNTPPTTNRKIGDLWFKTDEGNKMFVWTGSWTETKLDYQALSVGKLSAISADLGDVTAGNIRGVTMNLANGKVVVDSKGNAVFKGHLEGASGTFKGSLEGATGTFSGRLSSQNLYIEPPNREPNITSLNIFRMAFNPDSHAGYFRLRQSPIDPNSLELYTTDQNGIGAGDVSLILHSVSTDEIFTRNLSVNGNTTLSGNLNIGGKITNNIVEFNSGPSMDMTGGSARWRQSTSNYIIQNTAGSVAIVANGQQRHVFSATGTKTGGTIIVDGKNLGMSPIDSPQILIEYIEFNVPLSKEGTKVYIDKTYLKTIEEYAVFTNNGQIIEKGEDYIIVSGEGTADIRFVGERIGYKDTFFADMSVDEEEGTDEVDEEKKSD